jgi:hypothetical protein
MSPYRLQREMDALTDRNTQLSSELAELHKRCVHAEVSDRTSKLKVRRDAGLPPSPCPLLLTSDGCMCAAQVDLLEAELKHVNQEKATLLAESSAGAHMKAQLDKEVAQGNTLRSMLATLRSEVGVDS